MSITVIDSVLSKKALYEFAGCGAKRLLEEFTTKEHKKVKGFLKHLKEQL